MRPRSPDIRETLQECTFSPFPVDLQEFAGWDLTTRKAGLKYRKFQRNPSLMILLGTFRTMTSKPPLSPQRANVKPPCKHPRVQIVSRSEDAEFVECKECGEIFESSEFKDMNIEEGIEDSDA